MTVQFVGLTPSTVLKYHDMVRVTFAPAGLDGLLTTPDTAAGDFSNAMSALFDAADGGQLPVAPVSSNPATGTNATGTVDFEMSAGEVGYVEDKLRLLLLRLLPGGRWWLCPNPLPGVGLVTLLQRRRVPILLLLLLRLIIQCFCLALDAGSTRGACPCSCSCCCPPPLLVLVSRCGASTGKAESVLKLHLAIAAGRLLLGLLLLPRLVLCLLLETNPREGHCCCCCCTQCRRGDCAAAAAACCIWGHVGGKNAIPLH